MKPIPLEVVQPLIDYCSANNIGVAQIFNDTGVTVVIMGPNNATPEDISIIAAHMLLSGVISGGLDKAEVNEVKNLLDDDKNEKPKTH